jgi:lipoprotein-releasing system permease protein
VLAPIGLVQTLFGEEGKLSSVEIKLNAGADAKAVQRDLRKILGSEYKVETRYEQNHTLNSVMKTEKWATYAILLFVLLIASVNMIGAMSLLVLEKSKDMAILSAMGLRRGTVRSVFLLEGMLWAAVGGGIGILIGALVCLGQQRWGWVALNGDFIIKAYPVQMKGSDFVVIAATVLGVGLLAALYPALKAAPKVDKGSMGVLEALR